MSAGLLICPTATHVCAALPNLHTLHPKPGSAGLGDGSMNPDVLARTVMPYAPLEFRPASRLEGSPDLRQPRFSACQVPLVMW